MSQQINLASPQLLKPRYAFGLREMAIGLGVVLTGMLAWAGYLQYQASVLEAQAAQQEALQASAQASLDQLNATANRAVSPLLTARIEAAQAQVSQREVLLDAIRAILETTATGFSPRLRALAQSNLDGVWLNGFTLSPDHVELRGAALNAGLLTTYIDRLGGQTPFAGTAFTSLTASQAASTDKTADAEGLPAHLDFILQAGGSLEKGSRSAGTPP